MSKYNRVLTSHSWLRQSLTQVIICGVLLITARNVQASGPAPDKAAAKFEIRYMEFTIDHHGMGVQMSQLCLQRAITGELLDLCQRNLTAQSEELMLLQSFLSSWYGITYAPQMKPSGENMLEKLASLSGAEFEIEFMKMFIRHHFRIIVESAKCVDRAFHEQLEDEICAPIIINQSADIRIMQRLLCDLYRLCNYGPKGQALR
jgi:uncharacterized protein (DUF305 family)